MNTVFSKKLGLKQGKPQENDRKQGNALYKKTVKCYSYYQESMSRSHLVVGSLQFDADSN
jgi:hypothetical protein